MHQERSRKASPWRLLQLTDTHISAATDARFDGMDTQASLCRVLAHAGAVDGSARAILLSGDLVHEETPAAYRRLRSLLTELAIPVYCLPGNHDDPAMMTRYLRGGNITCPERLELPGWQVLLLNSHLPGSPEGHLPAAELCRLEQQLRDYPDLHALVCLHHQPVPIDSPWMDAMGLDNAAELLTLLDACPRVRAVVWGHIHQEFHARRGDMDLYGTPSTCIQFRPASAAYARDSREPGYRRLDLYPDGRLETTVIRLPPEPG